MEKLIRCTQCNKVIPRYHGYGDFGEISTLPGVEWSSEDLDQQKDFFRDHGNHLIEEVLIDPETIFSDRPAFESSKVTYMEATNGKDRFLIRRTKQGLSRPAFYELIPGRVQAEDVSLNDGEGGPSNADAKTEKAPKASSLPLMVPSAFSPSSLEENFIAFS